MDGMNALVLRGIGDLRYERVARPVPKSGEVLLRVKACGICSSDIPRIFQTGTYHFPTIPGHEFSGVIEAVGEDANPSLIGRRAAVFPLLPCFVCGPCQDHRYAQCRSYSYFGSRCDGAFAEYVAVPVWNLVPFGEELDFSLGALCEPLAVSLHAFRSAGDTGKSVAVVGTGTIGFMIGMIARYSGVEKVIMCGRSPRKIELARRLGFETADTGAGDLEEQICHITGGNGADVVFEGVGLSESVDQSLRICGTMGTVILVGNPTGDITIEKNAYWKILRQQLNVRGIWNSTYGSPKSDWTEAVSLLERHGNAFKALVTDTFGLDQAEEAFDTVRSGEKLSLKVMFRI